MIFEIYGPYEMQKASNGLIIREQKRIFWEKIAEAKRELPFACGCYLYAVRAGRGMKPWYIGKAVKQGFEKECLKSHQLLIYNDVISGRKGKPQLLLIALKTKGDRFAKPGPAHQKKIDFLETNLIGAAMKRNRSLMNVQKTAFLKKMIVPGFINSPKRHPTLAIM